GRALRRSPRAKRNAALLTALTITLLLEYPASSFLGMDKDTAAQATNTKKGNHRSRKVNPFHSVCLRLGMNSGRCPAKYEMATITIASPLKASSETSLFFRVRDIVNVGMSRIAYRRIKMFVSSTTLAL
ncbi:MAG: hypothetical protein L6M37_04595, partial [Candidatus Methylarchaceae archaeon HK02M1]|nr:hypothetical protein [Candidatus Methylarchaceae archaeon HK02M1]